MAGTPKNEPEEPEGEMTMDELRELALEADKDAPAPEGVTLGNHRFCSPNQNAPISRMFAAKKQVLGMPPPSFLKGIAREATKASPAARDLLTGEFCGHGEPTMAIFDIVVDGADVLDVVPVFDPEQVEGEENPYLVVARKPGGEWVVLFRAEWQEDAQTLEGVERVPLDTEEIEALSQVDEPWLARVAIGFEYPADATSADCVTWMTIECIPEGEKDPGCLVDAPLA